MRGVQCAVRERGAVGQGSRVTGENMSTTKPDVYTPQDGRAERWVDGAINQKSPEDRTSSWWTKAGTREELGVESRRHLARMNRSKFGRLPTSGGDKGYPDGA